MNILNKSYIDLNALMLVSCKEFRARICVLSYFINGDRIKINRFPRKVTFYNILYHKTFIIRSGLFF